MRRADDARLVLIDFGAVQACLVEGGAGSTVVGTSGYMPLEQLMGRAVAASDLYALAASVVHLLSQRHPSQLAREHMAIRYRPYVTISNELAACLDTMLAAHVEDRFQSAKQARRALNAKPNTALVRRADALAMASFDELADELADELVVHVNVPLDGVQTALWVVVGVSVIPALFGVLGLAVTLVGGSLISGLPFIGMSLMPILWIVGVSLLAVRRAQHLRGQQ